jgi:tetraacyldisaccharide 4'-kinase
LGGTGKTPFVAWLANWFLARQIRVAIVSRGYRSQPGESNDEAAELEQQLPDVPHLQNANRLEAAMLAMEKFESQLILLDDGFQHRRLHRDLDIVLLDATQPFGMQRLFPRGTLREPLSSLRRADAVVLTRADLISETESERIRAQANTHAPAATWSTTIHSPSGLIRRDGKVESLAKAPKQIFAFCGIGNPKAFQQTLQKLGYHVVGFQPFADHHRYARGDLEQLTQRVHQISPTVEGVICTQKDLVKISADQLASRPLYALAIEIRFKTGQALLERQLEGIVEMVVN